ncbi:MAG: hypothetical protein ACRENJ_03485 [Candidatus Eiseniibacteriota bacterium]
MSRRLFPCTVLALALLAGFATPAPAAPSPNLLVDPDFESTQAGHPWMPAGWDTSWSQLPTVFFGRGTSISHGGQYSVSVANVSTLIPLWHNWSQTLVVGPKMWNKDVVFTAWTRSIGVQGRGYILVQAYRDTIGKMARIWNVQRDTSRIRLGIGASSDPYAYLGAKRAYFSDPETDWVQRQVRVYVPPSTNLIVVRCGLFGTGQVFFDETSLTAETALPSPELPVGVNLLQDPGFEGDGNNWDYSLPPYDEMRCARDTIVVQSGKASVRFEGGSRGPVKTRTGVAQLIANRSLAGKRLRLSGWVKCDSLVSQAFIKIFCTTIHGDVSTGIPRQLTGSTPWTKLELESDVPEGTYQVWAWLLYNGPAEGRVYFDDASLEILGPAQGSPARPVKPASDRKRGRGGTSTAR